MDDQNLRQDVVEETPGHSGAIRVKKEFCIKEEPEDLSIQINVMNQELQLRDGVEDHFLCQYSEPVYDHEKFAMANAFLRMLNARSNFYGVELERPFFKCVICETYYPTDELLSNHACIRPRGMLYHCPFCNKGYLRRNGYAKHRCRYKPADNSCEICNIKFDETIPLFLHMQRNHEKFEYRNYTNDPYKFKCRKCDQSFETKQEKNRHYYQSHNTACKLCGIVVKNMTDHMKVHTKPHKCNICDASYAFKRDLKTHLILHTTDDGGVPCNVCKKVCPTPTSLYHHKRTHGKAKSLKRNTCE